MSVVAVYIQKLIILLIGCFYGLIVFDVILLKFICNPFSYFRVKRRDKQPSCLQDPRYGKHHIAKINGRKLHYVANGNPKSQLVLLIHGFPESWWSWRHQLVALADDYYVVAMSLPGFGDSEPRQSIDDYRLTQLMEDVRELIQHLGRDEAIIAGHDWGGALSWEFAYRYPSLVRRLIVLDCPNRSASQKRMFSSMQFFRSWYIFFHQLPWLPEILWRGNDMEMLNVFMASSFCGVPDRESLSDEDMECYKYYFGKNGFFGPLALYRAAFCASSITEARAARMRGEQMRIKPKTLVMWGSADAFLMPVLANDSASVCDDARVRVFEGASHWLQLHEPKKVTDEIRRFIEEP